MQVKLHKILPETDRKLVQKPGKRSATGVNQARITSFQYLGLPPVDTETWPA
jgi:hypothetical protein